MKDKYKGHIATPDEQELMESLRCAADYMDRIINQCCPPSREKSICLTKLEECLMWGNKSIMMNRILHPDRGV